jgi:polar amino acid transport system substrate-binding protein
MRLVADPYPPYQYELDGRVVGCDHELIIAAFTQVGCAAVVDLLPWDQCLAEIAAGRADGIFQIVRTPEREAALVFSRPFRRERMLFYRRGCTVPALNHLSELEAVTREHPVGVLRGFSYDPLIDGLSNECRLEFDTQHELMLGLNAGRIGLALLDFAVARELLDFAADPIEPVPGIELTRELCLAVRPAFRDQLAEFERGLDEIRAQALDRDIRRAYGLDDELAPAGELAAGLAAPSD